MSSVLPEVHVPRGVTDVDEIWDKTKGDDREPEDLETVRGTVVVESIICPWCKKNFNQSEGKPFTKGEWVKKLNVLDNESEIDKILEGEEISHIGGTRECMEWIK